MIASGALKDIRPQLADISESDFPAFRRQRLREMNAYPQIGTGVFAFGVVIAIGLLFHGLTGH